MKRKFFFLFLLLLLLSSCGIKGTAFTATAGKAEPILKTVNLSVVGDIMVHDYQYNEAYDPATGEYDFMHNFQDVKQYFSDKDIVLGNLETTFGGSNRPYASFPCFNTPDSFLDAVKDAGFDLLTTANNHSMDTGKAGLLRTLDKLDEYGIGHFGTYRSQEERDTIFYKNVNGIKFAFLSYTYGTNGIPVPEDYFVNILDEDLLKADIQEARKNADVVVVMPHMGNEYETEPRQIFEDWANLMFEAGADIVLASHPHVLQRMEYKKLDHGNGEHDGFIIYSLGNFISSQTTPPRNASIILNLTVEQLGNQPPSVTDVSFIPIWTQFRNVQNENDFVVRSVTERLSLSQEEQDAQIRKKDQTRLKEIHHETASFLLGRKVPLSEMQLEYTFPKP